jgi:hypothetical protein
VRESTGLSSLSVCHSDLGLLQVLSLFLMLCALLIFGSPSAFLFFFGGADWVLIQSSDFLLSSNPDTWSQA